MTDHDPDEVIQTAERQREAIREHYLPAVEWFLENPGMGPRGEVVADLAARLEVDEATANAVVGHLVEDEADPVQQVLQPKDGKFVGVIDHAEHDWYYAYDRYDDVEGRQRRAVCAHCVHAEREAADVVHFTRAPDEYDRGLAETALGLHYQVDHAERALVQVLEEDLDLDVSAFIRRHDLSGPARISLHDVTRRLDADPDLQAARGNGADGLSVPDVDHEPGASLVSGTTIGGHTSWHAGNDGAGTGLDADTVDGDEANEIWGVLQRDFGGAAFVYGLRTTSISTAIGSSEKLTLTLTPTSSWDGGFIAAYYDTYVVDFYDAYRNGLLLDPGPTINREILVPRVSSGETFQLVFQGTSSTTGATLSGYIAYASLASPTFVPTYTF